jgi:hypothetical protein
VTSPEATGVRVTLAQLLADPPLIHTAPDTQVVATHGLLEDALRWIDGNVKPGQRTIETGSGLSTITLALTGAEHTCIVPNAPEVEKIRTYCEARGIDLSRVDFHLEPSERVLPKLDTGPLDLVLIDGSHSFPQVFIDWFYTAHSLRVGGTLIVDDVHVWTGRVLRDFVAAEPEWEPIHEWAGRTAAFRKTAETDPDRLWVDQPYVFRRTGGGLQARARMAASMVRNREFDALRKAARGAIGR